MPKFDLIVNPEACTGCLRCALACSDLYEKSFKPAAARIKVEINPTSARIQFTEDCLECGICVEHCLYGALIKTERRAES